MNRRKSMRNTKYFTGGLKPVSQSANPTLSSDVYILLKLGINVAIPSSLQNGDHLVRVIRITYMSALNHQEFRVRLSAVNLI